MRILVLALAFLLAGCATTTPEPASGYAAPAEGTGAIEGLVVQENYRPLAGVLVTLTPGNLTTISNENGEFGFTNLAPGEYTISAGETGHKNDTHQVTVTSGESREDVLILPRVFSSGEFSLYEEYVLYVDCEIHAATSIDCGQSPSSKQLELDYLAEAPTYIVVEASFSTSGTHQLSATQDGNVASAQFNGTEGGLILMHQATSPAYLFGTNNQFDANKTFYLTWQPVGAQGGPGFDGVGATIATKADITITLLTSGLDPEDYCNSC